MGSLKQTAPGTAKYTLDGKEYMLYRTRDHYGGGWEPWYAYLGNSYGSGTAIELDALAKLTAHLAGVCRELDEKTGKDD